MKATIVAGAVVGAVCFSAGLRAQTPEDIVTAFHAALAQGDSVGALQLLDPRVVIFESGDAEMSRDEFASHHLGTDMRYAASTKREVTEIHSEMRGDMAIVISRNAVTGTFGDRDINSRGAETMVLRRSDGDWRIVHIHWSSRRRR